MAEENPQRENDATTLFPCCQLFSQHTVLQLNCKALGNHLMETLILWCGVCSGVHGVSCYSPSPPSLSHGCSHLPPSNGFYRSISRVPQVLPEKIPTKDEGSVPKVCEYGMGGCRLTQPQWCAVGSFARLVKILIGKKNLPS